MRDMQRTFALLTVAAILITSTGVYAQVTTATLYGLVRDSTGAVLPGTSVSATNEGTNLTREVATDERGDANYKDPNINILAPDFRKITSATERRTGQIGARLTF